MYFLPVSSIALYQLGGDRLLAAYNAKKSRLALLLKYCITFYMGPTISEQHSLYHAQGWSKGCLSKHGKFLQAIRKYYGKMQCRGPHLIDEDPDADPDSDFHLMRIRI